MSAQPLGDRDNSQGKLPAISVGAGARLAKRMQRLHTR